MIAFTDDRDSVRRGWMDGWIERETHGARARIIESCDESS